MVLGINGCLFILVVTQLVSSLFCVLENYPTFFVYGRS